MRLASPLRILLVLGAIALLGPGVARAGEPPNQKDPCSTSGRDTCGTTGVGSYETYRYGLRWFGDYRGAVPDAAHTFCIDLQYWYPSPSYRFVESPAPTLATRDGDAVPPNAQRRIAYAVWRFGRSTNPDQQAAVMLYVHSQMGDARPGEIDPSALGPTVVKLFDQVAADAARLHGPYRVEVKLPAGLKVGETATAAIRVLAASGDAVPNVGLSLTAIGARGVPGSVQTDASGVASAPVTAASADGVKLTVKTEPLASTLPAVYVLSTPSAKVNGQRLVAPASQTVAGSAGSAVSKTKLNIASTATPASLAVGEPSRDRVTITGAAAGWQGTIAVKVFGPFRSTGAIRCDKPLVWKGTIAANGSGTFTTEAITFEEPGWYVYREVVPDDAGHTGGATNCTDPLERVKVEVQPLVHTVVSAPTLAPGKQLTDTITVSGLAGETVTIQAALYGPFSGPAAISCDGTPVWTGTVEAKGDGEVVTGPFTPKVAGYYTYRETIPAGEFTRAAQSDCAESTETAIVKAAPKVVTQISDQSTKPGAKISDKVTVSGLGAFEATVQVQLWGPAATRGALDCTGTPAWSGSFTAKGDGTYTTIEVLLDRAGYYTYVESLAASPAYPAVKGTCGVAAETTVVKATPAVTTVVAADVVRPGSSVSDLVSVSGLGRTEARIAVELFGPFASLAATGCGGTPIAQTVVVAHGDGELRTPPVRVEKAGFYTFRERLLGSALVAETTTECPLAAETTLAAPQIITGRGDVSRHVLARADGPTPTRVQVAELGIDAPVSPAAIDLASGTLGVAPNIHRTGWWRDGSAPGDKTGAVLIAGHVDSATAGAGALFRLKDAGKGDRVEVTTSDGRTHAYRVVSVQTMPKAKLPLDVYSRKGKPRLVLVTCGGPFDAALGHYRDNVVVTAVPA